MLSAATLHSSQQGPGTNMGAMRAMVCEAYTMSGTSQGWAVNMIRLQRRRTKTRERRVPVSSYPIPSCLCPCYVSYPITCVPVLCILSLSHVCLCYVPCPITCVSLLCALSHHTSAHSMYGWLQVEEIQISLEQGSNQQLL